MKKITRFSGFFPKFEENKIDLIFNKTGLTRVNRLPELWELSDNGTRLIHKKDSKQQIILKSICQIYPGDTVQWGLVSNSKLVIVSEVKLIRLSDMTNELAMRAGVEQQSPGVWKHYSPQKFYPKKVLRTQDPGFPNYTTAVGSFHSLWCKDYDVMEIYANPWIWQYTCIAV